MEVLSCKVCKSKHVSAKMNIYIPIYEEWIFVEYIDNWDYYEIRNYLLKWYWICLYFVTFFQNPIQKMYLCAYYLTVYQV